jgi:hypothetical protein
VAPVSTIRDTRCETFEVTGASIVFRSCITSIDSVIREGFALVILLTKAFDSRRLVVGPKEDSITDITSSTVLTVEIDIVSITSYTGELCNMVAMETLITTWRIAFI